jgi:hypothetical protein
MNETNRATPETRREARRWLAIVEEDFEVANLIGQD